ncbi:hypothetical protein [Acaryochloris sp. IP29b_bin.148]|uniref:hypothetical protein n=1 Tax=Acaryochloris sp. IP29b_bin.148 TaxID=2969218 RepID=UPI002618A9D3|nr:hypothetical protein [Acaryochloris sp. IP29b_bin.148]
MTAERRYQSRLFNLILQQSRELTEQWQRNLRQAKVTTLWGMQMGLYPIYLLFQVSRFTQQVLGQGDIQGQRLLRAVADPSQDSLGRQADGPLRNVLEAIQIETVVSDELEQEETVDPGASEPQFSVQIAGVSHRRPSIRVRYQKWLQRWAEQNPLHNQATRWLGITSEPVLTIQGLACDLASNAIVLVTPSNDALDVLTSSQQRELQKLMVWELANYRRQQRLSRNLRIFNKGNLRQLPIPKARSQMLPPVKVFRRAMAWMQTGPMAAQVNLFQEALALPEEGAYALPLALPQGVAATLQQLTPKLTQDAIEMLDGAIASWETTSWEIMGPTATDLSEYVVQHWKQQQAQLQPSLSILSQDNRLGSQPPEHPIRYATTWVPSTLRSAMAALLGIAQPPSLSSPATGASTTAVQQSIPTKVQTRSHLSGVTTNLNQAPQEPVLGSPSPVMDAPVFAVSMVGEQKQATCAEDGTVDVDAVIVGYEKHPLERILTWLDRITVWLEKGVSSLWKRLWPLVRSYVQQVLAR